MSFGFPPVEGSSVLTRKQKNFSPFHHLLRLIMQLRELILCARRQPWKFHTHAIVLTSPTLHSVTQIRELFLTLIALQILMKIGITWGKGAQPFILIYLRVITGSK